MEEQIIEVEFDEELVNNLTEEQTEFNEDSLDELFDDMEGCEINED